jgi:hypothetical protein
MADSTNANQPEQQPQQQQKKGFFGTAASGLGMFLPLHLSPPNPSKLKLTPYPKKGNTLGTATSAVGSGVSSAGAATGNIVGAAGKGVGETVGGVGKGVGDTVGGEFSISFLFSSA